MNYVIELHDAEEKEYLGAYVSEEQDRPRVAFFSDACEEKQVGSVFSADEVDLVRTDLNESGYVLTIKTPVSI